MNRCFRSMPLSVLACLVLACLATAPAVQAGLITEVVSGATEYTLLSLTDDNDDARFSNFLAYDTIFTDNSPTDVVFRVNDSLGTTEYSLALTLRNHTGMKWTGFAFELGFGTGTNFTVAGLAGLDFDTFSSTGPHTPSSNFKLNGFAPTIYEPTELVWRAINLDVSAPTASMAIDIPNAGLGIPAAATLPDGYLLTLRHRPLTTTRSIPEPATVLPFLGLAIAALVRRRQRFSNQV